MCHSSYHIHLWCLECLKQQILLSVNHPLFDNTTLPPYATQILLLLSIQNHFGHHLHWHLDLQLLVVLLFPYYNNFYLDGNSVHSMNDLINLHRHLLVAQRALQEQNSKTGVSASFRGSRSLCSISLVVGD